MIELLWDQNDDIDFVNQIHSTIVGAAARYQAPEVYVIKIDNWFGSNWLGFTCKLIGAVGYHKQQDFVVPGFIPSRVRSESKFQMDDSGEYQSVQTQRPVHIYQQGTRNELRLLRKEFPEAVFFWWSGQSKKNKRGSLMCYYPEDDGYQGWYIGLARNDSWYLTENHHITKDLYHQLRNHNMT